jgi:transcriptional regulator with XRE-family HTH domain
MAGKNLQKELMLLVKAHVKMQGLTQADLAKKLKISVPTVKRWLAGGTITFSDLDRLCKTVGQSVGELIVQVEDTAPKIQSYTIDQEEFFVSHPDALAFFDQLIQGKKLSAIKKKFQLTDQQTERYLSQLDKQNLIQWLPHNRVTLKFAGEPSWQSKGPLIKKFGKAILADFLQENAGSKFLLAEFLPEDQKQIILRIDELAAFVSQCTKRAKTLPDQAQSFGIFIQCRAFRWHLDRYLMNHVGK